MWRIDSEQVGMFCWMLSSRKMRSFVTRAHRYDGGWRSTSCPIKRLVALERMQTLLIQQAMVALVDGTAGPQVTN